MNTERTRELSFYGSVSGVLQEDDGINIRINPQLAIMQESDVSWCIYSLVDGIPDDDIHGITVTSEDGKKLVREIMEMLADPVGFQKRAAAAFQRELAERSREDAA